MAKLDYCGPRGLWVKGTGEFFTQIIKRYVNNDGTPAERFVLTHVGEWRLYTKDHAWADDEQIGLGDKIYGTNI